MPMPGLFRENALRRVSSPDQLDELVTLAGPRRWLALAALLVLVAGAIVWAAVASVPTTLSSPGYLLAQGGVRRVQAPTAGIVTGFDLSVGEHVVAGQLLGRIVAAGRATPVRAADTGTVREVDTVSGSAVAATATLALVEPVGWPLVVYAYVPSNNAGDLAPGTPVHVDFGAGIGSTYGYATGVVQSVSQFAASAENLAFTLGDSTVVSAVTQLGGANEVVVTLDLSAHTPNGLVWGSGDGPPQALHAGLGASVTFILGSHHPIGDVL